MDVLRPEFCPSVGLSLAWSSGGKGRFRAGGMFSRDSMCIVNRVKGAGWGRGGKRRQREGGRKRRDTEGAGRERPGAWAGGKQRKGQPCPSSAVTGQGSAGLTTQPGG